MPTDASSTKKVNTPKQLQPILTPKATVTIKSGARQLLTFNSRKDWLLFVLSIAVIVILAFFVRPVVIWTFIVPPALLLINALIIAGGFNHVLSANGQAIVRKSLFQKTLTYPYRDINKILLVKNLTHYDGRAMRRTNGMALLIFTTDGMIPGFPFFEFGHESYFTKAQMLEFFNTFAPQDRIEIEAASRADILDGISWLRDGAKK